MSCILPRTTCEADFRTLCEVSCLQMPPSNEYICSLVLPLTETAMGTLCNCVTGALPYAYCLVSTPLRGVRVLHSAQRETTTKIRHTDELAHVVRDVFDSVASNRRQPQQRSSNEGGWVADWGRWGGGEGGATTPTPIEPATNTSNSVTNNASIDNTTTDNATTSAACTLLRCFA